MVPTKHMIRNTHSTMTAIKTLLFIFLALASVGSVLIVRIDVSLNVKMCEELFLNKKNIIDLLIIDIQIITDIHKKLYCVLDVIAYENYD